MKKPTTPTTLETALAGWNTLAAALASIATHHAETSYHVAARLAGARTLADTEA